MVTVNSHWGTKIASVNVRVTSSCDTDRRRGWTVGSIGVCGGCGGDGGCRSSEM